MTDRPRTRGECRGGERPCPWVSCRYHLAHGRLPAPTRRVGHALERAAATRLLDALERRALEIIDTGAESCALDVADRGEHTLEEVAEAIGTSTERARRDEETALDRFGRRMGKVEE